MPAMPAQHFRALNGALTLRRPPAPVRASREARVPDEAFSRLATRLADHYCSQEGLHSLCARVLSDVAGEVGATHGWILLTEDDGTRVEELAHYGDPGAEEAWRGVMAALCPLLRGGAPLEEALTEDGRTSVTIALRDGRSSFGAMGLVLDRPEHIPAGTLGLLEKLARLLSTYVRASLRSPEQEEARRNIGSKLGTCCYAPGIVGRSSALIRVLERVQQVAPTDATVLIEGENGTGKELVARALHKESRRAEKPWVVVNCAAIPEQLLESELFGHERGAFTGALERRAGRFEQADGGTVFLDEIGEMAPSLQVKLLRLLQEKTVQRLGCGRDIPVDVRFIAATNRNLTKLKEQGQFREDLFWRLYVVPIRVPALRERPEDIRPLVTHFLRRYAEELSHVPPRIDPAVMDSLERYHWPGNVRELQNLVYRLVILSRNGQVLKKDLPLELRGDDRIAEVPRPEPFSDLLATVPETYDELTDRRRGLLQLASRLGKTLENDFVDAILTRHSGNKTRAAEDTGMHRTLIHRNLRKRGLIAAE